MSGERNEATLGIGRLLGLFFGVVILCALFFVAGYKLGKASPSAAVTASNAGAEPVSPTAAKPETFPTVPTTTPPAPVNPPAASAAASASASTPPGRTAAHSPAPAPAPPDASRITAPAGFTVQVAAVTKQQDAEALADALRKKQYPVFIAKVPTDTLFHVQIGPFQDVKDADNFRNRLIKDGYNPIVKK
jgi:cell division septation protein DedD